MTQEEKSLLLKDLCARLPYGVICDRLGQHKKLLAVHPYKKFPLEFDNGEYIPSNYELEDIKPYLRPMSSMTEEEEKEFIYVTDGELRYSEVFDVIKPMYESEDYCASFVSYLKSIDWLNTHHFDYRGLIPMKLALEAKEGMYGKI